MMLALFCANPKPWLISSVNLSAVASPAHHRLIQNPIKLVSDTEEQRRSASRISSHCSAASIWRAILPTGDHRREFAKRRQAFDPEQKGEGSWNVAWDVRPARWLHSPDSAWLLFGVYACLAAPLESSAVSSDTDDKINSFSDDSVNYKITGVPADGRCLFRAIAHVACLRNGEDAPNENRQRELADDLRAQVVDELLKRRKDTEWFIEGDFDSYLERIKQPYVWGGEPELLMASHVLKTPISVFMLDRKSSSLIKIADYGEEYSKEGDNPIRVLFHGYGHYDILDAVFNQNSRKAGA